MNELDSVIVTEYVPFDTPADKIVADPEVSAEFTNKVNSHLPAAGRVNPATVNWRLLTLRKRGEDKGGLPRLERRYNGRKPKPR